jgi:hypothetical protein
MCHYSAHVHVCGWRPQRPNERAVGAQLAVLSEAESFELSVEGAAAQTQQFGGRFLVAARTVQHARDVLTFRIGE